MTFPKFDPNSVDFVAKTLEEWLTSLPQDSTLRVFHTGDENLKHTWLEWEEGNVIYCVAEANK